MKSIDYIEYFGDLAVCTVDEAFKHCVNQEEFLYKMTQIISSIKFGTIESEAVFREAFKMGYAAAHTERHETAEED